MGDGTSVTVQFSGLSAEDAAFYRQLWARHLKRTWGECDAEGSLSGSLDMDLADDERDLILAGLFELTITYFDDANEGHAMHRPRNAPGR